MANQVCSDAGVLAYIAEQTRKIMVSLDSPQLDLSLRLFAEVVRDVHEYLLDFISRGPEDEDGRSQSEDGRSHAEMSHSSGEQADVSRDLESWYTVSQPKLFDGIRLDDVEEQKGLDCQSRSDAASLSRKQSVSDLASGHDEDGGWSNDEIARRWSCVSQPEQLDRMPASPVEEEKGDSAVAHEVEEVEEEEQEEGEGRDYGMQDDAETPLERGQEQEMAETEEEKEEESGEGGGSGMSEQDRREYDGSAATVDELSEVAGGRSYHEGRIIAYRRIAGPTGGDAKYTHVFPPAVYLASLQFLSTLRCVMWEVLEPLTERYPDAAWGVNCSKGEGKHRLRDTTAMQSMENFKKHRRDILVCSHMITQSSGQSLPEMGSLARLIEWLPRVEDGTLKYSMEKVTKVIFKVLVTDGGRSGWYPEECIRALVHFMKDAIAEAGEDLYGEVEAEVVKGVDQQFLFDLSCAWSQAEADNRLEVQTRTSRNEKRSETGGTGSRKAYNKWNSGSWSSFGGKDGRRQSQSPWPWRTNEDDQRRQWRSSGDDGRWREDYKRARSKWT